MPARSAKAQMADGGIILNHWRTSSRDTSSENFLFNYRCRRYSIRWGYVITVTLVSLLSAEACMPQYEKELRYLNYYMGIAPANGDGVLDVNAAGINNYVEQASQLNCDLHSSCLWINAPTDGLLDTSEFYLFDKVDTKQFPIQVRPGKANHNPGMLFLLAGNTTNEPQSAVLISAPVLCQNSDGILTFEYWLHNRARIEVLQLRVNSAYGRLHVIARPPIDCHFLKASGLCRVEIRRSMEPFRLGIRAHALGDLTIGSFAMINGIRYDANVCATYEQPMFFNGQPLTRRMRQTRPIRTASDLNCGANGSTSFSDAKNCLWAAEAPLAAIDKSKSFHHDTASTQWAVGNNTHLWDTLVRTGSRPTGEFLYQYIDPIADLAHLPQLRSVVVPCTGSASALTFKYWLSGGVQAQLCTLATDNTELSCVYLNEADAPGPVRVDIDAADDRPFRFAFNVIKFPPSTGGVIALDEIEFTGRLCREVDPAGEALEPFGANAEETFLSPNDIGADNGILTSYAAQQRLSGARQFSSQTESRRKRVLEALFRIQPLLQTERNDDEDDSVPIFSPTLDCDFSTSTCAHWSQHVNNDEFVKKTVADGRHRNQQMFQLASVPLRTPFPHLDDEFRGNAAVAIFHDAHPIPSSRLIQFTGSSAANVEYALFTSQPISCAKNARLIVSYYSSGDTTLSVCAEQHCVAQRRPRGNLSVTVSAGQPFRLRVMALSGSGAGRHSTDNVSRRRYAPTATQIFHARSTMERYRSRFSTNRRRRPFRYRYEGVNHGTEDSAEEQHIAALRYPPFVLIKQIRAEGAFCRLETPAELTCKALTCDFDDGLLCGYSNVRYHTKDGQFTASAGQGAVAHLSATSGQRAILRSLPFRLTTPTDLRFDAALTTFGSRFFVCPGDFDPSASTESTRQLSPSYSRSQYNALNTTARESYDGVDAALDTFCQLVLGPKLSDGTSRVERIRVALDPAVRRVAFVALHDEVDTFGDALILVRNVRLLPEDGEKPIC